MIAAIAGRELRSAFVSPLAWTLLALVQVLTAYAFLERLERLQVVLPQLLVIDGAPGVTDLVAAPVFGVLAGLLLLLVPVLAMGAIAGERRRGTLLLLRSSPVSATAIVLGKWLALVGLVALALVPLLLMCASLALGTTLDWGKLMSAALGVALLAGAFCAAGVWVSSVARQPVVAAVATTGLLLASWLAGGMAPAIAPLARLEPLLLGSVSTGDVAYFVLATAWFLGLAIRRLDAETASPGWRLRGQAIAFVVLWTALIGVAGHLADRSAIRADWTHGDRASLAPASVAVVESMPGPLTVTAFARDDLVRRQVEALVARYASAGATVALEFVNPDLEPARARDAGVAHDFELVLELEGRREHVTRLDERAFSGALQRLVRGTDKLVAFVVGHGERDPRGGANHDLGTFGAELTRQGIRAVPLNPVTAGGIPAGTDALVVTQPRVELVPGVAAVVRDHVERGGDLLWLAEPDRDFGLAPLADALGITIGTTPVEDTASRLLGIDDPRLVVIANYGDHPVTRALGVVTLFPHAATVAPTGSGGWRATPLLRTVAGDTLGVALERGEQRVVVVGDGDFLSNTWLNNAGNLELGLNLVNWVVGDDEQIDITLRSAPDLTLELSQAAYYAIAAVFLLGLPLAYLVAGVVIRWRRRRR